MCGGLRRFWRGGEKDALNLISKPNTMNIKNIHEKIYEIRGQKVMLDFDLAQLYEVETRVLTRLLKEMETDSQKISCSG
jgi:hypothetical protein